ncbi:unnamed protein product [Strongylus vulgaris]|uniref:Uncharacterized protein n=1 Tax=Strongylus vulgaris TaxID=40348 RepID=A0A3P7LR74_STRVU|nr:unnamed protein product [Strongylus vulgaris]
MAPVAVRFEKELDVDDDDDDGDCARRAARIRRLVRG